MASSIVSNRRVLIGLLIAVLLVLGALLLAQRLILAGSSDVPSPDRPIAPRPEPPVLPSNAEPPRSKVDGPHPEPIPRAAVKRDEAPASVEPIESPVRPIPPDQGRARVLPPIQTEPEEEDVFVEPLPEPLVEDPLDDEPPPPAPPEQGPDFIR